MVKFPKKIPIGGHIYTVKFPYKFKEIPTMIGMCENILTTIYISNNDMGTKMPPSLIMQTLLHEVVHAIDFVYNSNRLEENEVENLSLGWYNVLLYNKLFLSDKVFKIPKCVTINGFKYKINYPYPYKELENSHILTDHASLNFFISDGERSNSITQYGLIHLTLSGIYQHYQMKYTLPDMRGLANGFYQVFKDLNMEKLIKENV